MPAEKIIKHGRNKIVTKKPTKQFGWHSSMSKTQKLKKYDGDKIIILSRNSAKKMFEF